MKSLNRYGELTEKPPLLFGPEMQSIYRFEGSRKSDGSLPVAILGNMAAAMPVVSTRHAGIQAVQHGSIGLLVDEEDTQGMADRIVKLSNNVGQRLRMGREGRTSSEQGFSSEMESDLLRRLLFAE